MINVIYFRPTPAAYTDLDGKLFDLATKHRAHMRLVVRHSEESGHLFGAWVSGREPTVLFVRDGRAVAELRCDLPFSEIESMLRCALSTPDDDVRHSEPLKMHG